MIDYIELKQKFIDYFQSEPRCFRAPGRVNLIGEHTDYNGGFVLPMAIDKETCVAIAPRNDRLIRAYSVNLDEVAKFDLDKNFEFQQGFWLNFVEGVARLLEQKGFKLSGANLMIWSNIPSGAGLSSSAALEIVCALSLSKLSGYEIDKTLLAQIGQQTEHDFVGAKVGIMDQFVSTYAKKNHALLLNCRSLKFENVSLEFGDSVFVICNTNVKHDLAASEYNTRRAECEKAVEILQKFLPEITQLRDVSIEDLQKYQADLPEVIWRRARHIVSENKRTINASKLLKTQDLKSFGKLMFDSHYSLRNDFEVSCYELDLLVETAKNCEGVLGARMTGGGFGGSTINLVKRGNLPNFIEKITSEYFDKVKFPPTVLVAESNNGATEIS